MKRALISVSNKEGIIAFAKGITKLGYEIISTGGTAKTLSAEGIAVTEIESVTGFPEMMDGRLKTLHPKIHGGILALRNKPDHMAACKRQHIVMIDLVVVNLYPFESTIKKPDCTEETAIEAIDIGGPTMIRAAAKNFEHVGVIVDPKDYPKIIEELNTHNGALTHETKKQLGGRAFSHTARYDAIIARYFDDHIPKQTPFSGIVLPVLDKVQDLRYGENPHQAAAVYRLQHESGLLDMIQIQGKPLSYNNFLDMEAAWQIAKEFEEPAVAIIKHTNPCGAAVAATLVEAYQKAYESDPVSAYGSIIGLNRTVDGGTATEIAKLFVEVVIAPDFDEDALKVLTAKAQLRLIKLPEFNTHKTECTMRHITGGMLLQAPDNAPEVPGTWQTATTKAPDTKMSADLLFANRIVTHVKSNAIVIAKDGRVLGVGAGQMSRVDSMEIALKKAGEKARGAVVASDAFFPFKDAVALAAKAGVVAIIQPGGSKRDAESIETCNQNQMAMVFTGMRHFKH